MSGKSIYDRWEKLTTEQQQELLDFLEEAAQEVRDQYEAEVNRLQQSAAQGMLLARQDVSGLTRQPIPPVPDVKRDGPYENLVLDTQRLVMYLAYLEACAAHLNAKGFDIGVGLAEYLHARTEAFAEGRVKAFARTLEEAGRNSYASLHSRVVHLFPERAIERLMEWDETSRQKDSWFDRLRRMLGEQ
jgi:hypothetical protein